MNSYLVTGLSYSMRKSEWVKTESSSRNAFRVVADSPAHALALGKNKIAWSVEGNIILATDGTGYAVEKIF